jgi:hypothetical protein
VALMVLNIPELNAVPKPREKLRNDIKPFMLLPPYYIRQDTHSTTISRATDVSFV